MTRCFKTLALLLAAAISVPATAADKDIVDTAVGAGSFKTLAAALGAADLVKVMKSKGPFTVFAPTDEAFAKLPKGTVETLLKPENKDKLISILTYHVVPGAVTSKQVVKIPGAATVNGQRVRINVDGKSVMINKAKVVKADIECSNGVIHVIDSVILPNFENIPGTAVKAGKFKTLVAAAKAAGLVDALAGKGPLTVFAPTDDAFAKLPKGTIATLLKPENKDKLAAILKYHVVAGRVYASDALKAKEAKTLQGGMLKIGLDGGKAKVNEAGIVATDIDTSNGVIHVIDSVLLPPAGKKVSANQGRKMIEHAVAQGARLYNRGHAEACAKVYMTTAVEMLDKMEEFPTHAMTTLKTAVKKASHCDCPVERSWTLRRGLDQAYYAMSRN